MEGFINQHGSACGDDPMCTVMKENVIATLTLHNTVIKLHSV